MLVLFLFPFYWLIITSFKTYGESIVFPPTLIPRNFTLAAFEQVFSRLNLWNYLKNSIIVTLSVIIIQTLVGVPAAYALARYSFRGKGVMLALVMAAFMVPTQITFITVYIMMSKLRWLNTLLPQIVPFGASAYGIFLLRQAFMQVPADIIEAARLDNASELKIITRIMLPAARSSLMTVSLFSFVGSWNSYFWPLVMSNSEKVRPLTLAIERLKDQDAGINWPVIMAGNMIMVLPVLVIFLLLSNKIISAVGYRGIK
ncbi:MAG: carbohydrate ABC transporter permease [Firmicutes bacterium]|nr:carbohydrate ABC transporter permease [Bacillota bacterium]